MRNKVLGVSIIVMGALLILTPWVIFPVCMKGRNAPPKGLEVGSLMSHGCHDTLRAETALGVVAIGIGVVPIMACRIGTMPALATLAVVMGLAGLIGLIVSIRAPD